MELGVFIQLTTVEGRYMERDATALLACLTGNEEKVDIRTRYRMVRDGIAEDLPSDSTWAMTLSTEAGVVAYFESDGCEEFPH